MKSKQKPPVLRRIKKKTGEVNAAALVEAGKATQFKPGQPSPNPGGRPRSEVGVHRVTSGAIQIAQIVYFYKEILLATLRSRQCHRLVTNEV
jgi:hypothetical protein